MQGLWVGKAVWWQLGEWRVAGIHRSGAGPGEAGGTTAFILSDEKPLNVVTKERHDPIFIAKSSLWLLRGRREASQVPEGVQSRE